MDVLYDTGQAGLDVAYPEKKEETSRWQIMSVPKERTKLLRLAPANRIKGKTHRLRDKSWQQDGLLLHHPMVRGSRLHHLMCFENMAEVVPGRRSSRQRLYHQYSLYNLLCNLFLLALLVPVSGLQRVRHLLSTRIGFLACRLSHPMLFLASLSQINRVDL